MASKKTTILIADDHGIVRESIADALADSPHSKEWEVVAQAADGAAAVEEVRRRRPDVVILDMGLPRLDGIAVLKEIRIIRPDTKVVIFSMHDDQAHVVDALRAQADAYLFKDQCSAAEVVRCVEDLIEGRSPFQDKLHRRLFSGLRLMEEKDLSRGLPALTPAELDVLRRAAFTGGSMKEIARDLSLAEATVRRHLENIYQKLGAKSQAHAVCLAVKFGLINPDGAEPSPR